MFSYLIVESNDDSLVCSNPFSLVILIKHSVLFCISVFPLPSPILVAGLFLMISLNINVFYIWSFKGFLFLLCIHKLIVALSFSAQDGWTCEEGILLLGPRIHSPSWRAEKNIYDQETSLGARGEKLCTETTTLLSWKVIPKANKEESEEKETW